MAHVLRVFLGGATRRTCCVRSAVSAPKTPRDHIIQSKRSSWFAFCLLLYNFASATSVNELTCILQKWVQKKHQDTVVTSEKAFAFLSELTREVALRSCLVFVLMHTGASYSSCVYGQAGCFRVQHGIRWKRMSRPCETFNRAKRLLAMDKNKASETMQTSDCC